MPDSVIPWTAAHQAPLSRRFLRQGYWSGLSFPSQGIFLTQGSNPGLLHCRQILYQLSYKGGPWGRVLLFGSHRGQPGWFRLDLPQSASQSCPPCKGYPTAHQHGEATGPASHGPSAPLPFPLDETSTDVLTALPGAWARATGTPLPQPS